MNDLQSAISTFACGRYAGDPPFVLAGVAHYAITDVHPKWSDATIEAELRAFLAGRTEWPSPAEFRAAGKGPLYSAASKAGGMGRWRQIFGI